MPCFPGFFPLNSEGIATGENGGIVLWNKLKQPLFINILKLDKIFFCANEKNTSNDAPSRTMNTTLFLLIQSPFIKYIRFAI